MENFTDELDKTISELKKQLVKDGILDKMEPGSLELRLSFKMKSTAEKGLTAQRCWRCTPTGCKPC
jgi:hypothetical protein